MYGFGYVVLWFVPYTCVYSIHIEFSPKQAFEEVAWTRLEMCVRQFYPTLRTKSITIEGFTTNGAAGTRELCPSDFGNLA